METLRADHGDLIEVLSRLQDMVQFNICVMFLSSLPFSSFSGLLDLKPMVTVNFPQYTKDEMNAILLKEAPPGANAELYAFHIKMTLSIFYMACRDLRKLQRLAILNFEKFTSAVAGQNSRIAAKKMHELWTLVQPQLTKDFRTLKANIIPAHDPEGCRGKQQGTKNKNIYQLPKFVKYLLLAAYLATHNPATSDRRFFVKSQLGKKRRKIENQYAEKIHEAQNFSLPRLVAIYSFLSDYHATKDQLMMNQLTNLCEMQLLERVDNSNVPLEEPKFKCLASFEFIEDIARSMDVEIKKYLYHFV
jgi:origin recognition complex subunit 5